ncbi:PLP-dependent cysteine synthase family protein [Kangiella shandongensis]|uniref:PLP-dependent cysteine synthase family protein n=1 Tax=Kangiella shandongensis TaxID=2763258 RepID=UPI001CC0E321|nr:cysteine synthase family protein [Kangiella shandongensis]
MKVYNNILEMVGHTPMVKFQKMDTGKCQLFGKLESQNPGASIKDRIAITMVETAEKEGLIKPGDTLIEATAGNTGLGLAMVAAQKGYKLKIVMPDKMSMEKEYNLRAFGAEVMRTRSDVGKGHPEYYQDVAKRLSEENGWYFINQFSNPANIEAHYTTTAPEIWEQLDGKVDAVVIGVGSGGTVTGIGRFMKEKNPDIDIVLADPDGSILTHYHETGEMSEAGSWVIEGIGEDFIPDICDMSLFTKAYTVTDKESLNTARELMLKESVMGGSSTGTLVAAALKYCQDQTEPKNVVTLVCDTGNRYLSKMYNDEWMKEKGFLS